MNSCNHSFIFITYEDIIINWKQTLIRYQEHAIVPPDSDIVILPAEIDMYDFKFEDFELVRIDLDDIERS